MLDVLNPSDPVVGGIVRRISQELVQYTPEHFQTVHLAVWSGSQDGQTALFYEIGSPDYPDQGTTEPSGPLNEAIWDLHDHVTRIGAEFTGFRMICAQKSDGQWGIRFLPLKQG